MFRKNLTRSTNHGISRYFKCTEDKGVGEDEGRQLNGVGTVGALGTVCLAKAAVYNFSPAGIRPHTRRWRPCNSRSHAPFARNSCPSHWRPLQFPSVFRFGP